jgi:hypothetical protein
MLALALVLTLALTLVSVPLLSSQVYNSNGRLLPLLRIF